MKVWVPITVAIVLLAGFLAGRNSAPQEQISTSTNTYGLLSKSLVPENTDSIRINFSGLRSQMRTYFSENNLAGSAYFEYLPTGTAVRVNGDQRYRAASLIKLPVAMELYKAAELGKTNLDQKVTLKEEWLNDEYGTLYQKGPGYELTLREAARIMLQDSDNTALRAVLSITETGLPNEERALGSLDIEFSTDNQDGILIGTRSYSSFFKCLYYACYNTQVDSQEILETLTKTSFNQRLTALLPQETIVAHKIGVFNTQVQSDCGIIYIPDAPFVSCVMLEGTAENNDRHIAALSKLMYDSVTKH